MQYGPATVFSADQIDVSAALTSTGSVVSSSAVTNVNQATTQPSTGSEVLTADRIQSTRTATSTGAGGSTTVTNGTVRTKAQDPAFLDEGLVSVPANPPPNYAVDGYIHLSSTTQDNYRIVFNEQVVNPDGSLTVNAVHEYFLGPILKGDLILGQSVCRWGTTPTTTTTTTSTTVPTTTTTVPKGKGGGKGSTTTTTTVPASPADLSVAIRTRPTRCPSAARSPTRSPSTTPGPTPPTR